MAVSSNQIIRASQFNTLQNRIAEVLGTGSGDFGYGQTVTSSQVSPLQDASIPDGDLITATQFNQLRADLNTAHVHQTGSSSSVDSFSVGDIIGADKSGTDLNRSGDTYVFASENATKGFNDLLDVMTDLETNRLTIDSSQAEIQTKITDERTNSWNGTIISEFGVNFTDAEARRHFFNSGGQIRIEGSNDMTTSTGNSQERDQGWNDLLENPGQIQLGHNSTNITGSSTGVTFPASVGNDSITSTYQTIFRKDASSGNYSNSYWTLEVRQDNASTLRFKITLVDAGPESNTDAGNPGSISGGVEEPVTADITFEYSLRRANGAVIIPAPAFALRSSFQ